MSGAQTSSLDQLTRVSQGRGPGISILKDSSRDSHGAATVKNRNGQTPEQPSPPLSPSPAPGAPLDMEGDSRPLGTRASRELGCPSRGRSGSNRDTFHSVQTNTASHPWQAAPLPSLHRLPPSVPPLPSCGSRGDELEGGPGLLSDVRLREKCAPCHAGRSSWNRA